MNQKIKRRDSLGGSDFCYLISHGNCDILFDLRFPKDWESLTQVTLKFLMEGPKFRLGVEKNVSEILEEDPGGLGIVTRIVEATFLSEHHFDHTRDPSAFPKSTELVVAPAFEDQYWPGYPTKSDSQLLHIDAEKRNFCRSDIVKEGKGLKIGRSHAFDYSGDGSFYLLDSPGHAVGHMCGLARVTSSPDSFIFFGGDCAPHGGQFRHSVYHLLPATVRPLPLPKYAATGCPGALVDGLQAIVNHGVTDPFFTCPRPLA